MPLNPPKEDPPVPPGTPGDVTITWEAREPVTDPTLGVPVTVTDRDSAHRLVTVGDSITQGFQSLAISKTNLSWPALVARALGLSDSEFRYPTYDGFGGLPFNLEFCVRGLQKRFGRLDLIKDPLAAAWLLHVALEIKHWWTHEADRTWHPAGPNHNLAIYSYDVQTPYTKTLAQIESSIAQKPTGWLHPPITPHDVDRAARRVLAMAQDDWTLLDAARALGDDGGIETLVVALGANNVLDVVIGLKYEWATGDADRVHGRVWSPTFFANDWKGLIDEVRAVNAKHVIVATVPHVTVVPLAAAVGERLRPDSRYFEYYTHYWLRDRFDRDRDPYLTGPQARAIDSAIDQYNETIVESVRQARRDGLDWYVFEMAGVLDRLAKRRYLSNLAALPTWWQASGGAYPLPKPLSDLHPQPDTQFFTAGTSGRTTGGLIALDGVHPTTIGYGIVAQEVIRVMETAGVSFPSSPCTIDFDALLAEDELMSDPPVTLTGDLHIVGWLNEHLDIITALLSHGRLP
ncbi:MAG TPA: hypothetical protein VN796_03085 [Acidimicrobiales bacterium]|nr:hypothetical protein [Acidimicrobiales bacterium]